MASPFRFLLPHTYWRWAVRAWWHWRYDSERVRREENARFAAAGFDRERAMTELNRHLQVMELPPFEQCGEMASVHWLLFACLPQRHRVDRVLEIGTYDGQTTALLARLFPLAEIVTLDLPETDPILAGTYGFARGTPEKLQAFEQRIQANTCSPNVKLLRSNSFFLPAVVDGSFDLIWIDGGHLFPEIAWDMCNAYHRVRAGGIMMCDDIIVNPNGRRDDYVSPDAHRVLRYVTERTHDHLDFYLKRQSPVWSADPHERKYVAMLHKDGDGKI